MAVKSIEVTLNQIIKTLKAIDCMDCDRLQKKELKDIYTNAGMYFAEMLGWA